MDILLQKQAQIRLLKARLLQLQSPQPDPTPTELILALQSQNQHLQAAIGLLLCRDQQQLQALRQQLSLQTQRNQQLQSDRQDMMEEMQSLQMEMNALGHAGREMDRTRAGVSQCTEEGEQAGSWVSMGDYGRMVESRYEPQQEEKGSSEAVEVRSGNRASQFAREPVCVGKQNQLPPNHKHQVKIYSSLASWHLNRTPTH